MFNTQSQISDRRQMKKLKLQIDTSIKFFIRQISSIYCKHERRPKCYSAQENHINGLNIKELYKILTIMIQPNPHIPMDNVDQEKNYNYQKYYMQAESQSNDNSIQEENHNNVEKQLGDENYQSQEDESSLKKGQISVETNKNKKQKKGLDSKQSEKRMQYYTTTQQQQQLIIDACKQYYESKKNLTKNQISIIARRVVGNPIFKASHNWVKRLLFRVPLLNRFVLGIEKIPNKNQVSLNQKPVVKSENIEKEDNYQEYFWNEQEILKNIKKAFRERSNKQ